jgi:hypothetical protein
MVFHPVSSQMEQGTEHDTARANLMVGRSAIFDF